MSERMNRVYVKREGFEVTDLGEGCVMIYDLTSTETHLLNEVMAYLYQMCDGVKNVEEIVKELYALIEEPEISAIQVGRECMEGLELMEEKNILTRVFI